MTLSTTVLRTTSCFLSRVPMELIVMVLEILDLKDKLSFADTCRGCRCLVSEEECLTACKDAGLCQAEGINARAMAKLLMQPRKGVSNWSHQNGVPKGTLDFAKVWPIDAAIREDIVVDLHPVFEPCWFLFLEDAPCFDDATMLVAPHTPILLGRNHLYMHEFLTSPPMEELRIRFGVDPLATAATWRYYNVFNWSEVAFRIRNPRGLTLGDFYTSIFKFLRQKPSLKFPLINRLLKHHRPQRDRPYVETKEEAAESTEAALASFMARCPTNTAMFDAYNDTLDNGIRMAQGALCSALSLASRELELYVQIEDAFFVHALFEDAYDDLNDWGHPCAGMRHLGPPWSGPDGAVEQFWDRMPVITC
ncbi:hypothetical protein B0H21DRAFT_749767 [Amylocystis lapponica]|nr:hypothetical protein B0H21DRAFT_749767 [Amylocystis lapponica]